MAENYEKIITQLKENLEKAKNTKLRAEAKLEQLNKQREEILSEIKSLGLEPQNIDMEIENLAKEIDFLIAESQKMLPSLDNKDNWNS